MFAQKYIEYYSNFNIVKTRVKLPLKTLLSGGTHTFGTDG